MGSRDRSGKRNHEWQPGDDSSFSSYVRPSGSDRREMGHAAVLSSCKWRGLSAQARDGRAVAARQRNQKPTHEIKHPR